MEFSYPVQIALTILFAALLGALSSIPVGAVQLEVIKKSVNGHLKPAIATACGSATSDLIYGLLTLFPFGGFLMHRESQVAIYIMGILVLSFMLWRTWRERHYMLHKEEQIVYRKRLSFLTGFTIAITNPGMIIWWIIGFKVYLDFGIITEVTLGIKTLFVISGCLGLGGYLILVARLLHWLQNSFSEKFLYRTNLFLFSLLLLLVLYFAFRLVLLVFNIPFFA